MSDLPPDLSPLPRSFCLRGAVETARALLGKVLIHRASEGTAGGIIVETEAYAGPTDAACHAFGIPAARPGHRTEVMFRAGGYAYVYLIYGMYHCFNVVAGPEGFPEAVLIRALEPRFGLGLMRKRRTDLTSGTLFLAEGESIPDARVAATPRINVDYSGEAAGYPYRFAVKDSPFLSTRRFLGNPNKQSSADN